MKKRRYFLPLVPGPIFWCYLILVAAAFLLAQGIKSPVTNMAFVLSALLPIGSLAQLIIMRRYVSADIGMPAPVMIKGNWATVRITVNNPSPFPVSYAEMDVVCVDKSGEIHASGCYQTSVLSYSSVVGQDLAKIDFTGEYTVEADFITVCDIFRLLRVRIPCKCTERVTVLPRSVKFTVNIENAGKNAVPVYGKTGAGYDGEPTDVRPYRQGDSLKRIHWKLSSKSEEIVVREIMPEDTVGLCVLCDMGAPFGRGLAKPCRKYKQLADIACLDAAAEYATMAIRSAVDAGETAEVVWMEDGQIRRARVNDAQAADELALRFAANRVGGTGKYCPFVGDLTYGADTPLVIVTSGVDEAFLKYSEQIAVPGRTDLVVCAESQLFECPEKRISEQEALAARLAAHGIRTHFALDTVPPFKNIN